MMATAPGPWRFGLLILMCQELLIAAVMHGGLGVTGMPPYLLLFGNIGKWPLAILFPQNHSNPGHLALKWGFPQFD